MGQPIVVVEKPSSTRGVVRFETNRALTGMGHERYRTVEDAWGPRPPDVLARRLLETGQVDGVHINSNVITVDLSRGRDSAGLQEIIENLYIFYPGAADRDVPQHPVDVAEGDPAAGAAPEMTSDPGAVAAPEVDADEAPGRGGVEAATTTEAPEPSAD